MPGEKLVAEKHPQLLEIGADRGLRLAKARGGSCRDLLVGKNTQYFQQVEVDLADIGHVDNRYWLALLAHSVPCVITIVPFLQ